MKTPFYYSSSRDREREFIRIRDNHTCQLCGRIWKEGERKFDVHHLEEKMLGKNRIRDVHLYDRKIQKSKEKILTLCHKCHMGLHKRK